eukprot:snap_masked-scaffold_43-processed-gene-0.10-mRNA-1 protein AED:1.00 eAED:1.00 QI:0/0/0/0/1/1/3/0/63
MQKIDVNLIVEFNICQKVIAVTWLRDKINPKTPVSPSKEFDSNLLSLRNSIIRNHFQSIHIER